MEEAKKKGLNMMIETHITNTPALELYTKAGFRPMELKLLLDHRQRPK